MKYGLFAVLTVGLATGCSKTSDYTPPEMATAEDIFKAACIECHKENAPNIFELSQDSATPAAVKERIATGNLMMPKFPNIQGESLEKLTKFVLENNTTK